MDFKLVHKTQPTQYIRFKTAHACLSYVVQGVLASYDQATCHKISML